MPDFSAAEIGQMILDFFGSSEEQQDFAGGGVPKMPAGLAGCSGYQIDQGVRWIADTHPASQIGGVSVAIGSANAFSYNGVQFRQPPPPTAPPEQVLAYHTSVYNRTTINDNDTMIIDQSRDVTNTLTQIGDGNVAVQQPATNTGDGGVAVGAGAATGPIIAQGPGAGGGPGDGDGPIIVDNTNANAPDTQVGGTGNVQDATLTGSAVGAGAVAAAPGSTVNQGDGSNVAGLGGTAAGSGGVAAGAGSGGIGAANTGTVDQSVDVNAAGGDLTQQAAGGNINQPTDVNVAGGNVTDLDAQINQGAQLADVGDAGRLATEAPLDGSVLDPDVDLSDPMV